MIRKNDIILVASGLFGIIVGMARPPLTGGIAPYIAYMMMALLFLSFLRITTKQIWEALRNNPIRLLILLFAKLILMPVFAYYISVMLAPDYSIAMLLLAGASTGVTAPFFVGIIGGNMAMALVLAVFSSLILPLSLPIMVRLTIGQILEIDLFNMALFLGAIIFIPLAAAGFIRRFLSRAAKDLTDFSFPISIVLIFLINTGIFGKYALFIRGEPEKLLLAICLASALGGFSFFFGSLKLWGNLSMERAGAAGSLVIINNVLIVVLGVHLDDALTSITAGLYMLPTFLLLVPLGWLARLDHLHNIRKKSASGCHDNQPVNEIR